MSKKDMTCSITSSVCAKHEFVHGKEADELRCGLEGIIAYYSENYTPEADPIEEIVESLRNLLDRVDARDSLAFLEAIKAQEDETNRTYVCAGCLKRVPWSNGAADDMPYHCDECWAKAHNDDRKKDMTLSALLAEGRRIWGSPKLAPTHIVTCMGVVFGDIARCVRDLPHDNDWKENLKKEMGNMILSTIRWADDLGLDLSEIIKVALEAQEKKAQQVPRTNARFFDWGFVHHK